MNRTAALAAFVAASALAALPATAQQKDIKRFYRIVGVGDTMMGSNFPQPIMPPTLTPGASPSRVMGERLTRIIQRADVAFANVEGTIHNRSKPHKFCRNPRFCYVFRSPPHHAAFLKRAGFDVVSLANNHAGDFLGPGRIATVRHLRRAGLVIAGIDQKGLRSGIYRLGDGTRVGIIAFAPNPGTIQINKIRRAARLVRGLARRSDITIVSFHGGAEGRKATRVTRKLEIFLGEWRGNPYAFSHAVIDAGADIVFGHGPHVPRAVEVYKRRPIFYSLGNFFTYGRFNLRGYAGIAPVAEVRVRKDGRLVAMRIHSVKLHGRGIPRIDPQKRALKAVRLLTRRDFPEGRLKFHPNGEVTGPGIGR